MTTATPSALPAASPARQASTITLGSASAAAAAAATPLQRSGALLDGADWTVLNIGGLSAVGTALIICCRLLERRLKHAMEEGKELKDLES